MAEVVPILVSVLYISLTCLLTRVFEFLSKHNLSPSLHRYVSHAISAFYICGLSLEKSHIRVHYGMIGYVIISILGDDYYRWHYSSATANPCDLWTDYLRKKISKFRAIFVFFFQLAGGLITYQFAKLIWYWGLTDFHLDKYTADTCPGDLKVSILAGFLLEFGATVGDLSIQLLPLKSFGIMEFYTKVFSSTMIVISGIHMTGMYWNPINAMNNNFGCKNVSHSALFIVYWLGPLLAHTLFALVQMYFYKTADKSGHLSKPNGIQLSNGSVKEISNNHIKVENNNNVQNKKSRTRRRYYTSHKQSN